MLVPPTVLKKFVTGKGNSKKDEMRLGAYKRWAFEDKSDDVVDAYCLAQMGLYKHGLSLPTNAQKEAIIKMTPMQ